MGCDIHLVLEKHDGDKWIGVDTFTSHHRQHAKLDDIMDGFSSPIACARNYERFAKLAGVRGPGPSQRGIPDDASETTKFMVKSWGEDGHSHSWMALKDATKIWLETECRSNEKPLSEMIRKYPENHFFNVDCSEGSRDRITDYRVIFWFDN